MKFILSMIMCSSVYNSCLPPHNLPELYDSYYECLLAGYKESVNKAKEIGPREVNKYGTVIKFICIDENLFLPKVKGNDV